MVAVDVHDGAEYGIERDVVHRDKDRVVLALPDVAVLDGRES